MNGEKQPRIPVEIDGQVVGYTRLVWAYDHWLAESIVIEPDGHENRVGLHRAPTDEESHEDAAYLVRWAAQRRRVLARVQPSLAELMDSIEFEET